MNATDLVKKAEAELQSAKGYHYNPQILKEIIENGSIEDGAVCMVRIEKGRDARLVYRKTHFEKVVDGMVEQTMPMSDAAFEAALIMYAKREARMGTSMGRAA
ncbi:hypothetical protein AGR2A_Cc120041 [Agrobacterium genomosp. 2 str. CFBP 5494]|uniref:Uncharacterized protein n=2 Tax=Agrobacterium tumefaciens complex TaxID=1183400 RepID=A0A9W5F1D8_9HYPH|nr:hypothetical protein AGR2A_Cc120041 [Agrobacterium genomosp. 2 str. CFBP 5494]